MPVLDETKNAKIEREKLVLYVLPSVDVGLVPEKVMRVGEGGSGLGGGGLGTAKCLSSCH